MSSNEGFWWYITIEGDSESEEDLVSLGELSGSIGSEMQELPGKVALKAYYRNTRDLGSWMERVQEVISPWPGVRIADMGRIENRQWHTAWKEAFPPLPVGDNFIVMAPWHRGNEPEGKIPVYIYPGSAFGTGYHESTQIALELLEKTVKPGLSVADIGTGSGILSIASALLGAGQVLARDNDPAIINEVRENLRLNDISPEKVLVQTGDLLAGVSGKYGIICANIVFDPLASMLPSVPSLLEEGGVAVFSGLTLKERDPFLVEVSSAGLSPVTELTKGDWWGVAASRTP
ncbi:MAG TPA: 50S ribosomal protein L11 methyltransferase [Synergistales bacterium]|jgi:ribosomal protein L11 methyltransferase|nr:50S ribosomal protein L11 methyltransferase [Synergistales bacterium]HRV70436.1 50S ribosomal protein L11 methyltransferase [Thermovirgaceae bacterium]